MIFVVKALNRSKLTLMPVTAKTKTGRLSPAHKWKSSTPLLAPNGKPSNLNPAQWKMVRTPEFNAWFGDWEIQANNKIVNQKIEEWSNGNLPTSQVIQIGKPGSILSKFGVPNLPIYLTQHILSKATKKKHDVDVADLKDITVNIQAPICIFRSKKGKGSIILVTEKRHRDGNIIVAVELAISREGLQINDITSIYPKRDESISQWISDGLLWGYEYKNGREWIENSARSNCGQPQTSPAIFKSNIYRVDEIRKVSKVLDENGEPRVVYHGTYNEFHQFSTDKINSNYEHRAKGFHFSEDYQTASEYAQDLAPAGYKPKVIAAYLNEPDASKRHLQQAHGKKGYAWVVQNPNQIKSATGNSGRFDMNDSDIRKALDKSKLVRKMVTVNPGNGRPTFSAYRWVALPEMSSSKDKQPKKTAKAYKLFRVDPRYPGQLFPLFVDANTPVPFGEWVDAKAGDPHPKEKDHVKSKLGPLAYRPGWHAGRIPVATHIGLKQAKNDKAPSYRNPDYVWAEVLMPDDVDWQTEATRRAERTKDGKILARTAHITDQVPSGGYYSYKTNSNMTGEWMIGGSMKVLRVLQDSEVQRINENAGFADLPRQEALNLADYGFDAEGKPSIRKSFRLNAMRSVNETISAYGRSMQVCRWELKKSLTWSGYKLQGRTRIHGMDISIENKKGSVRRGTDKDGHAWRTKMHFAYGYIRGTVGKDKDHLDCYIGPNPESTKVYIIHQNDPVTGKYDEDKVMLGFNSTTEAKQAYLKQYDRPGFFGSMDETTIGKFKSKAFSDSSKGKKLVVMKSTPKNRIYTIEELKAEGEKYVIEFLKRFDLI